LHNNLQPGQDILQLSGAVSGAAPLFTWVTASDDYQKMFWWGWHVLCLIPLGLGRADWSFQPLNF
jgi:hypothetical protein